MRWLAVVVVAAPLAACAGAKASGPAWPAPSTTADDGGETLEPRTTAAASLEKSADAPKVVEPEPEEPAEPEPPAAPADDKPDAEPSTEPEPVVDDVIITDDVIIEIEDDE